MKLLLLSQVFLYSTHALLLPSPARTNSNKNVASNICLWVKNPDATDKIAEITDATLLLQQAQQLRDEADMLRKQVDQSQKEKKRKRIENVDRWIDELLINIRIDDATEMLNTEEQVVELIKDKRFAAEHINQIFDRICETSNRKQSTDNCSPLISLLLDAACKVDCMERKDNPNKRWNHRVERDLRKKLFAMGWGINLDDVNSKERIKSLNGDKDYS